MKKRLKFVSILLLIFFGLSAVGCQHTASSFGETDSGVVSSKTDQKDKDVDPDRPNADTRNGMPKTLSENDVAPDFTADLMGGGTFKLSDYDDKMVLLNFWATWCPPCVGEMHAFEKLKKEGIQGLEIICVDCMEDKDTVKQFINEKGYTFNVGYDTDGRIGAYYPTEGIPYTLVINKGKIYKIYVGAYGAEEQYKEYKKAIEECMGK